MDTNTQPSTDTQEPTPVDETKVVDRTPTQRLGPDGQPLEPPPGHGGRPQE